MTPIVPGGMPVQDKNRDPVLCAYIRDINGIIRGNLQTIYATHRFYELARFEPVDHDSMEPNSMNLEGLDKRAVSVHVVCPNACN